MLVKVIKFLKDFLGFSVTQFCSLYFLLLGLTEHHSCLKLTQRYLLVPVQDISLPDHLLYLPIIQLPSEPPKAVFDVLGVNVIGTIPVEVIKKKLDSLLVHVEALLQEAGLEL